MHYSEKKSIPPKYTRFTYQLPPIHQGCTTLEGYIKKPNNPEMYQSKIDHECGEMRVRGESEIFWEA